MTDWPQILRELKQAGMTFKGIAREAECDAKTLYNLMCRSLANPRYPEGKRIVDLHRRVCDGRESQAKELG